MRTLCRIVFAGLLGILAVNPALADPRKTCTIYNGNYYSSDREYEEWCAYPGFGDECWNIHVSIESIEDTHLDSWHWDPSNKMVRHRWTLKPGEKRTFESKPGKRFKVIASWMMPGRNDGHPDSKFLRAEIWHQGSACFFEIIEGYPFGHN